MADALTDLQEAVLELVREVGTLRSLIARGVLLEHTPTEAIALGVVAGAKIGAASVRLLPLINDDNRERVRAALVAGGVQDKVIEGVMSGLGVVVLN